MPLGFCTGYTIFTYIIPSIAISCPPILKKICTAHICFLSAICTEEGLRFSVYIMSQIFSNEVKVLFEDWEKFLLGNLSSWRVFFFFFGLPFPINALLFSDMTGHSKIFYKYLYSQDKFLLSTLLSNSAADILQEQSYFLLTPSDILTSDHFLPK